MVNVVNRNIKYIVIFILPVRTEYKLNIIQNIHGALPYIIHGLGAPGI